MNDTELNDLLNTWTAPPVRPSWRARVQDRLTQKQGKRLGELFPKWKWLLAGTSTAAVIVLLANASAFFWMLNPPPYVVDSEIRHYRAGSTQDVAPDSEIRRAIVPRVWDLTLLVQSYNEAGSEVILSASFPNRPFQSAAVNIWLNLFSAADRLKRSFAPNEESEALAIVYPSSPRSDMALVVGRREALMSSGCRTTLAGANMLAQEMILNYPVTVVEQPNREGMERVTVWMAPELSCFALRATIHAKQPDGTWKLTSEKQAVKVTVNR